MINYAEEIFQLIKPLFDHYKYEIQPATNKQLEDFEKYANENSVDEQGINELKTFYKITNGIPCLDSLDFHKIDDQIMFEFWNEKQLWLGQRDMDMITWKNGKFHLGSAGELSYGDEYIFENILDLLKKGFNDWYPNSNGKYPN